MAEGYTPFYSDRLCSAYAGDSREVLPGWDEGTFDAVIADPPYALSPPPDVRGLLEAWLGGGDGKEHCSKKGFMDNSWDSSVPDPGLWATILAVMKPGAYLLAFASPRTHDLTAIALRLAGFEIRTTMHWVFSSGYPKSLSGERAVSGELTRRGESYEAACEKAEAYRGLGTALKPSHEHIIVARKGLGASSVGANLLAYGTGALNIESTRVPLDPTTDASQLRTMSRSRRQSDTSGQRWGMSKASGDRPQVVREEGRYPPEVLLGCCGGYNGATQGACEDCPPAHLDSQSGELKSGANPTRRSSVKFSRLYGEFAGDRECRPARGPDSGGASRFYPTFTPSSGDEPPQEAFEPFRYCPKASRAEREGGWRAFPPASSTGPPGRPTPASSRARAPTAGRPTRFPR